MPAGDGTGPTGMGPRPGRGMGYRTGYNPPGWANPRPGRRCYVRGGGRRWRDWYYATEPPCWARWGAAHGGPVVLAVAHPMGLRPKAKRLK